MRTYKETSMNNEVSPFTIDVIDRKSKVPQALKTLEKMPVFVENWESGINIYINTLCIKCLESGLSAVDVLHQTECKGVVVLVHRKGIGTPEADLKKRVEEDIADAKADPTELRKKFGKYFQSLQGTTNETKS